MFQSNDRYWTTEPCPRLGYKRDASTGYCVDIDECVVGPGCRDHEKCMNTPGGYDCSPLCSAGWYFSTTTKSCQDVDECLLGRHECPQSTHRCVNTNGSFICELIPPCSHGFRRAFNGSCLDIDECSESLHNCRLDLHQYCINKEGSFECLTRLPSCPSGYQYSLGSRQCEDIDECLTGQYKCDAKFSERCVNLPGTYRYVKFRLIDWKCVLSTSKSINMYIYKELIFLKIYYFAGAKDLLLANVNDLPVLPAIGITLAFACAQVHI